MLVNMAHTTEITPRDIMRNYKGVFERVNSTKQPAIVVSHKQPVVAIVSLEDLRQLQEFKEQNSTKALLDFTKQARTLLANEKLPKDLAANHDQYLLPN